MSTILSTVVAAIASIVIAIVTTLFKRNSAKHPNHLPVIMALIGIVANLLSFASTSVLESYKSQHSEKKFLHMVANPIQRILKMQSKR